MGLIENQTVKINLSGRNIKHLKEKGYILPYTKDSRSRLCIKKGTCIDVNVLDIQKGSEVLVEIECDGCYNHIFIPYFSYNHYVDNNNCYYCNKCVKNNKQRWRNISETHPELINYFVNKEDAITYSHGSNKNVNLKCPECGYIQNMKICNFINRGFSCQRCGDGISYPEKFIMSLFIQLNIEFIFQLSKKNFKWCQDYRYDFYIPDINCIVEVQGGQHFKESKRGRNLQKEQENDVIKERLAKENNINQYICIDCRNSNIDWIKQSILKSDLLELIDFKFEKDNINWIECHKYACNSFVKKASEMWNNGLTNTLEIAKELKVSQGTAIKYLKDGAKLKYTSYLPNYNRDEVSKPVRCINTNEIFKSQEEAGRIYGVEGGSISRCCRRISSYAGKNSITKQPLKWEYV